MHEWLSWLADILGASRYAAHSLCLSNDPFVVNLYVLSDMAIMVAYFVIGGLLLFNARDAERFIRFLYFRPAAQGLFGAFIFGCGLTHGTMTMTLYYGVYYLDLLVRAATGGISVATAIMTAVAFLGPSPPRPRG